MAISTTELRTKLYKILDQVLATGEPVEIHRRGQTLRIVPGSRGVKLDELVRRAGYLKVDPDSVVHQDWSNLWQP